MPVCLEMAGNSSVMLGREGSSNWVELTKHTGYTQFVFKNDYSLQKRVFPLKIASVPPYRNLLVHHRARPSREPRETGLSQCIVGAELTRRARSGERVSAFASSSSQETAKVPLRGPSVPTMLKRDAGKQDHRHLLPQVHLGVTWQPAGPETELGAVCSPGRGRLWGGRGHGWCWRRWAP